MTWVQRPTAEPHRCDPPTGGQHDIEADGPVGSLWRCDDCGKLWEVRTKGSWLPAGWWQRFKHRNKGHQRRTLRTADLSGITLDMSQPIAPTASLPTEPATPPGDPGYPTGDPDDDCDHRVPDVTSAADGLRCGRCGALLPASGRTQ